MFYPYELSFKDDDKLHNQIKVNNAHFWNVTYLHESSLWNEGYLDILYQLEKIVGNLVHCCMNKCVAVSMKFLIFD